MAYGWLLLREDLLPDTCTQEVGDIMMWSTIDLPMTYANQDCSRRKLLHQRAGPYKIINFSGPNAVELELLADITIYDTVNVSRLKKYITD